MKSVKEPVRRIVGLLVAKDYEAVANITGGQRLDSLSIKHAISDYGKTLIFPPESAFEHLDIVQIENVCPPCFSVRMNLWTAEEQQSDLSLELTLIQADDGYIVELDDIHVL